MSTESAPDVLSAVQARYRKGAVVRDRVPLVFGGDELLWVAGVRPAETRRVGPLTHRRLRLSLGV
jgi:hypothetical protein